MKIMISEIKRLLSEATCPLCGDPNAYQGLSSFECSTKGCPNFSQKQASLSDELVDPVYVWSKAQLERLMDEGLDDDDVTQLWAKLEDRFDQDSIHISEYEDEFEDVLDDVSTASYASAEMRMAPLDYDEHWEEQHEMFRDLALDKFKKLWKKHVGK